MKNVAYKLSPSFNKKSNDISVSLSLSLSPSGHLNLYEDLETSEMISPNIAEKIQSFFSVNESIGLLRLGLMQFNDPLPPSFAFWQQFSQLFIIEICKHVAAVLYGVGARLDTKPEELFILRQVDHVELIAKAGTASFTSASTDQSDNILDGSDLSSLFGIDMGDSSQKILTSSKQEKSLKKKTPTRKLLKPIKTKAKRQTQSDAPKKTTRKKSSTAIKKSIKKVKKAVLKKAKKKTGNR